MKNLVILLVLIPFFSVAQENEGRLTSPEQEHTKGPKFKNERTYGKAKDYNLVSQSKDVNVKGPKYKNMRKGGKASASNIQVVSYDHLKGPAYKNKGIGK